MCFCLSGAFLASCSDDEKETEYVVNERIEQWGECMRGDNQTLKAFPDTYAFYWEYTYDVVANSNIGLRLEGEYPNVRFFNFNAYDDDLQFSDYEDNSMMDVEILPDEGNVNPFVTYTSAQRQKYTLYVVPASDKGNAWKSSHKNVIRFEEDAKRASVFMRYYLPKPLVYAGVSMPKICAFDLTTGKDVQLPKREKCSIHDGITMPGGAFPVSENLAFLRAPFSMMYPNRPSEYCYNRNQLMEGRVMVFNFRAPTYPKNVSEFATADMRYWSIAIGGEDTYCYASIADEDTKIAANGFANYVVLDKNSANRAQILKVCEEKGYNVLEWDRAAWKPAVMIFYRNMDYNDKFEHSMRKKMEVYNPGDQLNPMKHIAVMTLGEWGPSGKQVTEEDFLSGNFELRGIQ